MMKKYLFHFQAIIILIISALILFSCNKDKDEDTTEATPASIVGSWQLAEGDYMSTITFIDERQGVEYFFDGDQAGMADFLCTLDGDMLTLTYDGGMLGDYADYNGVTTGGSLRAEVTITQDELTFIYEGESYVYSRLSDENSIDENDLVGNWQHSDGDYRGVLNFRLTESAYHTATECFVSTSDSGAADFAWDLNGNMFMASYYYGKLYGDYGSFNEIENDEFTVGQVSVSENQLTFTVGGEDYIYTRMTNTNLVDRSDLRGSYWKTTDGTYAGVISFNTNNNASFDRGMDSFIDGVTAGSAKDFSWTVSGDLFTVQYQGFHGDYAAYNEVSYGSSITLPVSYANDQLTFTTEEGNIVYTRMTESEIVTETNMVGTWTITDGTYSGTLIFNDNGSGSDSFTDEAQSGSANISWYVNGNMITVDYSTMTGDYESYNEISPYESTTSFIQVTGNQATFTYEGTDYVYTKSSK